MESYKKLFDSIKGTKLDLEYEKILQSGNIEERKNFISKNNIKETYEADFIIFSLLFNQTLEDRDKYYIQLLYRDLLMYKEYIKKIFTTPNPNFKTDELVIETNNGPIRLIPLSNYKPQLLNEYRDLETTDRANTCFYNSRNISQKLEENNDLVTGIVYGYTDKSKYLHSWVEVELFGEMYVVDYTMNAIINKDGYYRFRHAKEIERINKATLLNDKINYGNVIDALDAHAAFYNVFRDEILKDLERNESVLK